jgi:hypothetical protein
MKALRALLESLIDYAGTAPPAALSMSAAMRNFADYGSGEHKWLLGRFVLPLAGVAEFEHLAAESAEKPPAVLSVTALANDTAGMHEVVAFNRRASTWRSLVKIDTIEVKAEKAEDIRQTMSILPENVTAYFEIGAGQRSPELLAAIAETGARAKIRTGGVTAQMFPTAQEVAAFMNRCAVAKVAFKATAGLHHPLRSLRPFTPQPESAAGMMHGFINVFLAAAHIYQGGNDKEAVSTLEERSPEAFRFDDTGVRWHANRLTAEQMEIARKSFAISLGSCSFTEPADDLRGLGWL